MRPSRSFLKAYQGAQFLSIAQTARNFNLRPSRLLGIADETVALAVELAATMALADYDLEVAKYAQLQAAAAIWGVKSEATSDPEIVWETVRELE